jgi:glycerol kinase
VQWLRDALKIIASVRTVGPWRSGPIRRSRSIWCRPLSAWVRPYGTRRRAEQSYGLTRNSGGAELAKAALESVGYQTRDLLEAMRADWPTSHAKTVLRVDGGMTASDPCMQFLSDILACPSTGRRCWKRPP